jgi:predicted aconitase with swiveling domain
MQATTQIAGQAAGEVLKLQKPISFWGGVDPKTGRISDPRHPDYHAEIAGKILVLPGMIGSSSSTISCWS